jgi:hypothetical protein
VSTPLQLFLPNLLQLLLLFLCLLLLPSPLLLLFVGCWWSVSLSSPESLFLCSSFLWLRLGLSCFSANVAFPFVWVSHALVTVELQFLAVDYWFASLSRPAYLFFALFFWLVCPMICSLVTITWRFLWVNCCVAVATCISFSFFFAYSSLVGRPSDNLI